MRTVADRLWNIMKGPTKQRPAIRPQYVDPPTMKDTLFIQLLLEKEADENEFKTTVAANAALARWASGLNDDSLIYLIWLQRELAE